METFDRPPIHGAGQGPSPADLADSVFDLQYVTLAVLLTLIYDIVTTFDQEVHHLYRRKTSIVQVLWFLNRILAPLNVGVRAMLAFWYNPPQTLCRMLGQSFGNWMSVVNILVIQCLLALRTAAIYERSLRVSLFIAAVVTGSTVSRIVLLIQNPIESHRVPALPNRTLCLDFPHESNSSSFYGPVIVDATLYFMTILRLYRTQSPWSSPGVRRTNSLLSLLYRDGAIYFLVVATAMAISVIGFFDKQLYGAFAASGLYIAACSIACSRLVLHLKESARQAIYRNWSISRSWDPPLAIEPDAMPTHLSRSAIVFGFACDGVSLSPEVSGSCEGMGTASVGREVPMESSDVSVELTSLDSVGSPLPSPVPNPGDSV